MIRLPYPFKIFIYGIFTILLSLIVISLTCV